MIYSIDIYKRLTLALNRLGIKYGTEIPEQILNGRFSLSNGLGLTMFRLIVGNEYVTNQTYLTSEQIPYTWPMIDFINRANQSMVLGNFEFFLTGTPSIRFRYSLPWSAITEENLQVISALVRLPSMMFTRFMPGMRMVAQGSDVGAAIQHCYQR